MKDHRKWMNLSKLFLIEVETLARDCDFSNKIERDQLVFSSAYNETSQKIITPQKGDLDEVIKYFIQKIKKTFADRLKKKVSDTPNCKLSGSRKLIGINVHQNEKS